MFNEVDQVIFNEFLNSNTDVKTVQHDFDYNSFYRAYVESIDDPEHLGRVKVRIPMIQGKGTDINELPWAYPACFTGLGNQVGQFMLPPVGSIVFVTFEYSDEHRPIYFGGIPTIYADGKKQSYGILINGGEAKEVTTDDIPTEFTGSQAIVYKAPTGAVFYFDNNDLNKKVVLKDDEGKGLLLINSTDSESGEIAKFVKLQLNQNSYLSLDSSSGVDSAHLFLNGEEVPFGESGHDKNYFYTQNIASDTWVIRHNLNKYPSVTVVSSSGDEVLGDVHYDDVNQVTLTFKGAFKGKATLN